MVRRVDTSDEDSRPAKPTQPVKQEKTKGKGKGKAREEEEEGSPKGAKRARANDAGDAVQNDEGEEEEQQAGEGEGEAKQEPPKRVKTLPRDVDGFIPGSILRIQLRNFVTYDSVEFRPGAFLNMILGPNGTGKSSIACAICLGLNWPPKILGRAAELNSFVKLSADTGHIEIELKAPAGERNLTIRRNLSAKSKSSSFTLNGRGVSGAEITEKVSRLNVQCGNLCSFLPQDKVSEFAAMTPVALLRETQRAAGDARLTQWHDTLVEEGRGLKTLVETIRAETASVRQLQDRNDGIERDVQRYRERKRIEQTIAMLKVLIPVQHYREARKQFIALKARQRAQHLKVSRLQEKNRPAHALLEKLDRQHTELHDDREAVKKGLRAILTKIEKRAQTSEALEGESDDIQLKLTGLKRAEKNRLALIKSCEATIEGLKEEMEKDVKVENRDDVVAEGRRIDADFNASSFESDRAACQERRNVLSRRRDMNNRNQMDGERQLKALDDSTQVKLSNLSRWDRDVGDAVRWLRQNRGKFKMEVFEPPALSVSVPDQSFAAGVESCFGASQMKMFVCQCQEDYNTLNHHINDNPGLGRRARVPTWFRPGTEREVAPPPLSADELAKHNFDGYALSYVECADGLKWFLMRELNMHRTAISRKGVRDLQGAIDAVARPGPGGRTVGASFVDGMTQHQVSRSKYGQRNVNSSAQAIPPAKNLGGTQVNPADKQRIDDILKKCKQEAAEMQDEDRELGMAEKRVDEMKSQRDRKLDAIRKRLKVIKDEGERKGKLKFKLETAERSLATALKKGDAVQEGARYRAKIMDIAKKRIALVAEAVNLSQEVINEQIRATKLGLQYLQVGVKMTALKALCDRKDAKYQTALAEFNKIDTEFEKLKETTKTLLAESKELLSELSDEMRESYQIVESARLAHEKAVAQAEKDGVAAPEPGEKVDLRSMEELQTELEKQEANLEMNMNTNPGVVEQYEKRKRDIAELQKTIEGRQRQADKIEKGIKNARDNWEPALQSLVTSIGKKFSAAFDRIGCAGEIRVRQEEAYDQWAIDILVKFRDTEKLQLLTGQRQSGGERSLTTILYLMSLTEEARAPFSLVDEINQGMDQRAERMVHNSMVEVTCKPDSAQYFLITPKLLPDLEYHERMKILCVNNGEWLPEESGLGNMMSMIDGFVAKNSKRA
ncbi:P-loop containing nucleoside triphosphate hydrolase protein [Mycena rosella]|uniref:Structural maintenance of chromosomes protein 5 n=1 Tax=Mycena rosella TaxID=1033263 RepID=A0AAD7GJ15_MYCRO|nr:P-loop containing nucleoside triphosphate hydrolase protein [Mycena rosella]